MTHLLGFPNEAAENRAVGIAPEVERGIKTGTGGGIIGDEVRAEAGRDIEEGIEIGEGVEAGARVGACPHGGTGNRKEEIAAGVYHLEDGGDRRRAGVTM